MQKNRRGLCFCPCFYLFLCQGSHFDEVDFLVDSCMVLGHHNVEEETEALSLLY